MCSWKLPRSFGDIKKIHLLSVSKNMKLTTDLVVNIVFFWSMVIWCRWSFEMTILGQALQQPSRSARFALSKVPYWLTWLLKTQYPLYIRSYALQNVQWSLALCNLRAAMPNIWLYKLSALTTTGSVIVGANGQVRRTEMAFLSCFLHLPSWFRPLRLCRLVLLPTGFSPWIIQRRAQRALGGIKNCRLRGRNRPPWRQEVCLGVIFPPF